MGKRPDYWLITLERFNRQEKPDVVLMLAGSAELTRIALAWCGMPVEPGELAGWRLSPESGCAVVG